MRLRITLFGDMDKIMETPVELHDQQLQVCFKHVQDSLEMREMCVLVPRVSLHGPYVGKLLK